MYHMSRHISPCQPAEAYLLASSLERIGLGGLLVARGAGSESQHGFKSLAAESFVYIGRILSIWIYTVYVNRVAIEASPLCIQFARVAQACRIGRI